MDKDGRDGWRNRARTDANGHHVDKRLSGAASQGPGANALREVLDPVQHGVHLGHHVLPVHVDHLARRPPGTVHVALKKTCVGECWGGGLGAIEDEVLL